MLILSGQIMTEEVLRVVSLLTIIIKAFKEFK